MKRRLTFVICLVAVMLSFVVVQLPVKAQGTPIMGTVTASLLRVRDMDSTHGKILTLVKSKTVLTILGTDVNRTWLKVQLSASMTGWVSASWVKLKGVKLKNLTVIK